MYINNSARIYDAGIDNPLNNFKPILLDDIIEYLKDRESIL